MRSRLKSPYLSRLRAANVAGCVSIPTRYVHQSVETLDPEDLDASVALVAAFCETAQALVD